MSERAFCAVPGRVPPAVCGLLAWLALFPGGAVAQLNLPDAARAANREQSYCAWVSLQVLATATAARYPGDAAHQSLKDLVRLRSGSTDVATLWRREGDGTVALVRLGPGPATPELVRRQLRQMGVRFRDRLPPDAGIPGEPAGAARQDVGFLREACRKGHGAMVEVRDMPGSGSSHALVLLDISPQRVTFARPAGGSLEDYEVRYFDCNDPKATYRVCLSTFLRHWSGWAVVLDPRPAGVPASP